jgi:hypothetical protein
MPQYQHRERTISISTMSVGDRIRVHAAICASPDTTGRQGGKLRSSRTQFVEVGPMQQILDEALESAKRTVDALCNRAESLESGG